jgi:hypothetical protein
MGTKFWEVFAPRETTQATNLEANFQREAIQKVAKSPPGTKARCHFK